MTLARWLGRSAPAVFLAAGLIASCRTKEAAQLFRCAGDESCPASTPCHKSSCDLASGACVSKDDPDGAACKDCFGPGGCTCLAGQCQASSCTDGFPNGDETDVDCGGKCGPTCADGKRCKGAGDCKSGLCSGNAPDAKCAPCAMDADCGPAGHCDKGACVGKKPLGGSCGSAAACQSDFCVDGFCCQNACAGLCQTCNASGVCSTSPCGETVWSANFGDANDQEAYAIAVDAAGNSVVTGYFAGSIDFGGNTLVSAGGSDVFVAKLDPAGKPLWSFRFGDAAEQYAASVALDSAGDVLLTGGFFGSIDFGGGKLTSLGGSDVFVVKLDPSGKHLWSKRYGSADNQDGTAVAVDAMGNVALTGYFRAGLDFGTGPMTSGGQYDVFVAELDPSGKTLWSKRFGDATDQYGLAIAAAPGGDVVVGGSFFGSVDFGGGALASVGSSDAFVTRLDAATGKQLWSARFGGGGAEDGTSVAVDAMGNALLGGTFQGTVDFGVGMAKSLGGADVFAVKLASDGKPLWLRPFGGAGDDYGYVATDAAGNILLTGSYPATIDFGGGKLTSAGGIDAFVAKLDPDGKYLWGRSYGKGNDQQGIAIAADPAGYVYVTGSFAGTIDFGNAPLATTGGLDVFVARLAP